MTQYRPKKSNRPLPDGWDEKEVDRMFKEAADKLFGGMADGNGVLKITPASMKEILKRAKKQTGET